MSPNTNEDSQQELKNKLKQIRADYTRAKNLIKEIEGDHKRFVELRAVLDDPDDGIKANDEWIRKHKIDIEALVTSTQAKVTELDTLISSTEQKIELVSQKYSEFEALATQIFDSSTGLAALYQAAKQWHDGIQAYYEQLQKIITSAQSHLGSIETITESVNNAQKQFKSLMNKINDPKTGIEAQFDAVVNYAEEALKAKNDAETELASVIAMKNESTDVLENIKETRDTIENQKKESDTLTNDIRNNLGLSSSESLSESFRLRTEALDKSLKKWGQVQAIAIGLLVLAVGFIFYVLFLYKSSPAEIVKKLQEGPTLVSVLSKTLFASPLIFAVYFTSANYNHVRDLRDRYAFKETIAKSLQAYIKLLRVEFDETEEGKGDRYKQARLNFSLNNMDTIYKEPVSQPKKKKYNFGINRIFQVSVEDEDIKQLEKRISNSVEDYIEDKAKGEMNAESKTINLK